MKALEVVVRGSEEVIGTAVVMAEPAFEEALEVPVSNMAVKKKVSPEKVQKPEDAHKNPSAMKKASERKYESEIEVSSTDTEEFPSPKKKANSTKSRDSKPLSSLKKETGQVSSNEEEFVEEYYNNRRRRRNRRKFRSNLGTRKVTYYD